MKVAFFASSFLYISDITLTKLSLFSNSEINISVAPWSSFYAFKDILCTNQAWPATLLKKRLWHRCVPVNFAKFLRVPFLQKTSGWLLLPVCRCFQNRCIKIWRLQPQVFSVNITKFLRTTFFIENLRSLLLRLILLYIFKLETQAVQFETMNCCLHG